MKKVIIAFILGGIVFGSIGIYAASYLASDVSYTPTDSSWDVSNVNDAINSLYSMKTELNNIKSLGDATAEDIVKDKTAVVNGKLITGTGNFSEETLELGTFSTHHWNSDGNNYAATYYYDVSNYNKIKLTVSMDKPDGTITIATNEKTLLSTNCSNMSSEYIFDVSTATTFSIHRLFTYGHLSITVTKVE